MSARLALLLLLLCGGSAWSDVPAVAKPDVPAAARSDGIAGGCVFSSSSCRCFGPSGVLLPVSVAQCELVAAPPAAGRLLGGGDLSRYEHAAVHLPVDVEPLRAPARPRGVGYALDSARAISRGAR